MNIHFIFSTGLIFAALRVRSYKVGVKNPLPIHVLDHLGNRSRILADHGQVEICHSAITVGYYASDGDSLHPNITGQSRFQICEQS